MPLILQPLKHYAQFGLNVNRLISLQIHMAEVCAMMFTQLHQFIFVASLTLTLLSLSLSHSEQSAGTFYSPPN